MDNKWSKQCQRITEDELFDKDTVVDKSTGALSSMCNGNKNNSKIDDFSNISGSIMKSHHAGGIDSLFT